METPGFCMFFFLFLAESYAEPVDIFGENGEMAPFSQIGPPQNLTLEINEDGEYILKWEKPEYGYETLRYYILRWWKEPDNILYGEIKTPDYQYRGELKFFLIFTQIFN